jgi:hypothetical protein
MGDPMTKYNRMRVGVIDDLATACLLFYKRVKDSGLKH